MSLRRAKQILYAGFYILVWYGIISGVYYLFLKPVPSCFDNIKNQGEAGVDCGGLCAQVCVPEGIKPIALLENVFSFQPDQSHLSLLAHINNPNFDSAARSFKYSFLLYDEQGNLVQKFSGNSFAYAGEVKYILVPNVVLPRASFSRVDFKAEDLDWVPKNSLDVAQIVISGFTPSVTEKTILIDGRVINKDKVSFPKVTIVAIFSGRFGEPAAASETEIENLAPNESQPFSVIHPALANIDIAGAKVFVYAKRP